MRKVGSKLPYPVSPVFELAFLMLATQQESAFNKKVRNVNLRINNLDASVRYCLQPQR